MHIDFHHAATYVIARNAGFNHEQADLIAYAAQYVDDAVIEGNICFTNNDAMYQRIASAHKTIDAANIDNQKNRMTWLPFHFLPGNAGLPAGQNPPGSFVEKLICTPDSPIARDMLQSCNATINEPSGIYRLGITMHVYADTFAHQGFAGLLNDTNKVTDVTVSGDTPLAALWDNVVAHALPPIGHGCAQTLPDMPFLHWEYTNGHGTRVDRDNTTICMQAADAMCRAMQACRTGTTIESNAGLTAHDNAYIRELFTTAKSPDPLVRHQAWLAAIKEGRFSFGSATIAYDATGRSSWKAQALGTSEDREKYFYDPGFLTTRWKYFHDALQQHRLTILHNILPKYGICAG